MRFLFNLLVFVLFCILFDLWHKYAFKRCIRFKRCREWMCKYYHECDYSECRPPYARGCKGAHSSLGDVRNPERTE